MAGYFIESAINHYVMTGGRDRRLYDAAKKLADCWADHIGPPPKQEWFDGHQEMEQALVRFGRFVNDMEGHGRGDRYIQLARFLLDCRKDGSEYDQSHVPVQQQYEAVGHAVRAAYTYSGMADVAALTTAQVRAITAADMSEISTGTLNALGTAQFAAFSSAQAAAAMEAFKVILDEPWRIEKLWANTHQFINGHDADASSHPSGW